MVKAFDKILRQGRQPNRLQTDRGKEFYNRTFKQWTQKHGIHHFSTYGDAKAALVERFNRTLKERLYRYFTAANTFQFVDELPGLVEGYNATRHRAIGMAPQDVTWNNEEAVWKRLYSKWLKQKPVRPKSQVGDRMRLNKVHRTFEKGYLPSWIEEVFLVHRVIPGPIPTYKIHEWDEPPCKAPFTTLICKKCSWRTMPCFAQKRYLSGRKTECWSSGKGGPASTTVGFPVKPSPHRPRRRRKIDHDVSLVVLVLRDPHESRRHGRVSEQPTPSFQKPVAAPHSICGSGLAGGTGQFVLTLRPSGGGKLCRCQGSPVVRTMVRTRVEHRQQPIVP